MAYGENGYNFHQYKLHNEILPPVKETLRFVNRFLWVGGLIGIADKNKNGLLSKNIYASKFRSISAGNSKIVSFYVPRYTRGVINVLAVSTQNTIFYKEFKFIVDMNTGKPSLYGDSGDIRYKIESQGAMIYMKLSDYSTVNYYYQYAEILGDAHIVDAAVLDDFPSDAVSL